MHAVIRRYRVRLGTMEQAARSAEKWFIPMVRKIPGFRAYYLMAEDSNLASVGLFETAEAAEAASSLSTLWFGKEWGAFRPLAPEVISGEVVIQEVAERRVLADRRHHGDRLAVEFGGAERRRAERRGEATPLVELQAAG
jgi:hypothetical protein